MTAVAAECRSTLLSDLQYVAQRGDVRYLRLPEAGEFAVWHLEHREKAFYKRPVAIRPERLHAEIEWHFGIAAERVAEFVWAI